MANPYLNKRGLAYFWNKIKAILDTKQPLLTFDSAPTADSNNPVTSGGVYAALSAVETGGGGSAGGGGGGVTYTAGNYIKIDNNEIRVSLGEDSDVPTYVTYGAYNDLPNGNTSVFPGVYLWMINSQPPITVNDKISVTVVDSLNNSYDMGIQTMVFSESVNTVTGGSGNPVACCFNIEETPEEMFSPLLQGQSMSYTVSDQSKPAFVCIFQRNYNQLLFASPSDMPGYSITMSNVTYDKIKLHNDALLFDSLPTEGSSNLITSGAVYTALNSSSNNTDITTTSIVLSLLNWSDNIQTVSVVGVTTNNLVQVSPAPASISDYTKNMVYCSEQSNGYLTFNCTTTPANDITVNVVIYGGVTT